MNDTVVSHSIVAGFDAFEDSRKNDNYQSGSGFRLNASNTIFRGSDPDDHGPQAGAPRALRHESWPGLEWLP
ncbi:MAG TPA: hypothetical protein VLL75_21350 [Vicinamibacteria bacterium]|nr:hypothetical protein [Vicinamibacteria bacterium]